MYIKGEIVKAFRPVGRILHLVIKLDHDINPRPGQFIMLWVPGIGEIPLSVSDYLRDLRLLELIVARVGKVTTYIHEHYREGTIVAIRGPYGNGFSLIKEGRPLVVAGGSGLAPFPLLLRALRRFGVNADVLVGFRSASEMFHIPKLRGLSRRLIIATDDGTYGIPGLIPDVLKRKHVRLEDYDVVYVCGKEPMIAEVVKLCHEMGIRCEASLERLMKCGIGVCGACVLDEAGLRVCKDGPVFEGSILVDLEDFSRFWRDHDGRKIKHPHC